MKLWKMAIVGMVLGLIGGSATNASAWWHRSKDVHVIDTSSMRKIDAQYVNVEIFDFVSQTTAVQLCRLPYNSSATYCSSAVIVSGQGHKSIAVGSKVALGWTGVDFGYVNITGGNPANRSVRGLFMSN